jgi:murein tripeptide amidase MpaA
MFEKMMLHIIPTLNPDGAEIATAGQCTGEHGGRHVAPLKHIIMIPR